MSILEDIKKYRIWNDYVDLSSLECKLSIHVTMAIILLFYVLGLYEEFTNWMEIIKRILLAISTTMISTIGIVFAGVTLTINTLKKDVYDLIIEHNDKDAVKRVFSSFKFLILNMGIGAIITLVMLMLTCAPYALGKWWFYSCFAVYVYWFLFIILYLIGLINNVIDFYFISIIYQDANCESVYSNVIECINEQRSDYLLKCLLDKKIISLDFKEGLKEYIKDKRFKNEKEIIDYIDKHYQ